MSRWVFAAALVAPHLAAALVAPKLAAAEPRKLLVLQSEGRADAAVRAKIDASITRLAAAAEPGTSPGELTFSDAATAVRLLHAALDKSPRGSYTYYALCTVFAAELALAGFALELLFGIPLGILAAMKPGSWIDQVATVIALIAISLPQFAVVVWNVYLAG